MRKQFLSALALLCFGITACNSASLPTQQEEPTQIVSAPEPVAAPQPSPKPVEGEPGVEHNSYVLPNGYWYTKTLVPFGGTQYVCTAAFGVYPGGEQGAGTKLYEAEAIYTQGDFADGKAPVSADCKYKQIQIDITQTPNCGTFNFGTVLAARVVENPNFGKCPREPEPTPTPTPQPTPTPTPTPTPSPSPTPTPEPTCEQLNPPSYLVQSVQVNWDDSFGEGGDFDQNGISSFNVNVRVFNQGSWKLVLEARPNSNSSWTLKDESDKDRTCGQQVDLTVHENNHDWPRWRFRILRNNVTLFTSSEYIQP